MEDSLSLVGLVITFSLAIVNLVTAFRLEKVKRNYDFLKFKFDKLFEIKEIIISIKNKASDVEIRRASAEGDNTKVKELARKYLNTYRSASNNIITQLLKYSHLFSEKKVKTIWDNYNAIENLENKITDIVKENKKELETMLNLMEEKLILYRSITEWGMEFIEKELRDLVRKMELGNKQKER